MAVAWVLARFADWQSLTSRPTWQRLMDTAGIRRSTVAKYLRLLRDARLLGIVETGTTPQFRSFLHRLEGNRAAVYVLCTPCPASSVEETRTPSGSPKESLSTPPHAREDTGEHLAPATDVQRRVPVLSEITVRHLRWILRPWWDAGWTVSDVLWCLDHTPDGALWPHTDRVRHVPGWVRHRLSAWAGLASPSQQRAAHHQELLAEQAQRRAERAALRAAAASPEACRAHAARTRELLRRSPVAARILDRRAAG